MSNLGTVYEINLATGMKNTYPVVYRNKTKIFCKIYGCDDIETFYDESYPYLGRKVVSLDTYKKIVSENPKWVGNVYVPPHIHYWFEEMRESFFSRKITELENRIKHLSRNIVTYNESIRTNQHNIEVAKGTIRELENEIKKYEALKVEYEGREEEIYND